WGNEISVSYKLVGNEMALSIPRTALLLDKATPEFYFKWADNPQNLNDITAFFTDGETAPDRRFNYNFSSSKIIAVPQTPFKTMNIPGTVQLEDFDNGGAGVAYADATFGNSGGAYRTTESVDIEQIAGGGYAVGWINSNEWITYTIDVKATGIFTANIHYVANSAGNEAILYVDGNDKSGVIPFPSSSGVWTSKSMDIQLTPGKHILKFFIKNASTDFKLDKIEFNEKNVVYPSNGTGLSASIWSAALAGRPWFKDSICSEIDPVINKTWADVSPGCAVRNDFWNIRWQGEIQALYSETHTFYLTVNDMGRVWINNQLIIDGWNPSASGTTLSGTIALTAGKKIPIKVDFAEKTEDAWIKLEWSSPSMLRNIVPQSQLFPLNNPNGLNEIRAANFSVYPNPATNKLNLNSGINNVENIKIFDLQGRVVYTNTEQFSGQKSISIGLEKGIYFIKLTGKVPYTNQKLIVD
ncbi:MAG: PA14 domain-containing protein, partial [Paludibacter sp.]